MVQTFLNKTTGFSRYIALHHNIKLALKCSPWASICDYGLIDVKQITTEHSWLVVYLSCNLISEKKLHQSTLLFISPS